MSHLVLLGDSIFDNERYVPDGPSVTDHLRRMLPGDWQVTLLAVDGAAAEDVPGQLGKLPKDATHLVVSAGGNNALEYGSVILHEAAESYIEVLTRLTEMREEFRQTYRHMLRKLREHGLPLTVCTIYDTVPHLHPAESAGLGLFNEVILKEAFRLALPLIDLRLTCSEDSDYSTLSPIEPSATGGAKIARGICRVLLPEVTPSGSRVYL